jgi:hypothetical protein
MHTDDQEDLGEYLRPRPRPQPPCEHKTVMKGTRPWCGDCGQPLPVTHPWYRKAKVGDE